MRTKWPMKEKKELDERKREGKTFQCAETACTKHGRQEKAGQVSEDQTVYWKEYKQGTVGESAGDG